MFIVGAMLVAAYLHYRVVVLLVLAAVAFVVSVCAAASLVTMSRRRVVTGDGWIAAAIVLPFAASAIGPVVVGLLWEPPAGGEGFERFVRAFIAGDSILEPRWFLFVAYRLIGAVAYVVLAIASMSLSAAVMCAVNLHIRAVGRWLWLRLSRQTAYAWSAWAVFSGLLLATIAVSASGGWLFDLVTNVAPDMFSLQP